MGESNTRKAPEPQGSRTDHMHSPYLLDFLFSNKTLMMIKESGPPRRACLSRIYPELHFILAVLFADDSLSRFWIVGPAVPVVSGSWAGRQRVGRFWWQDRRGRGDVHGLIHTPDKGGHFGHPTRTFPVRSTQFLTQYAVRRDNIIQANN